MATQVTEAPKRTINFWQAVQIPPAAIIWIAVVLLLILARITSEDFLSVNHLLNVARQASVLGILAIGQTIVLSTGGLDLSNGMVITLVNVVAATLLRGTDDNLIPVVAICMLISAAVGATNGVIIAKLKVPPLVVTLGMFNVVRGIAHVYTEGAPKGEISPFIEFIGSGFVENVPFFGRVPTAIFFWIGFTILGILIMRKTTFGRHLFAVGGNEKATRLSGVHTDRTIILAYVACSLFAAVAGLMLSGYRGTGSLEIGDGRNLDSIVAAVIGGTALSGGTGSVIGTAGGALFVALLISYLRFQGFSFTIQLMVQGVILAIAAYLQVRAQR